jgi:hypothetical protein
MDSEVVISILVIVLPFYINFVRRRCRFAIMEHIDLRCINGQMVSVYSSHLGSACADGLYV